MKNFRPWLLVSLAAWLGHREKAASSSSSPSAGAGPAQTLPAWIEVGSSAVASADFDTLLRRVLEPQTLPLTREKSAELRMICARLAELDPEAALKRLGEEDPESTWLARMTVLTEWALLDSDAARAFLPAGKEGDQDRSNITGMLLHDARRRSRVAAHCRTLSLRA